MNIKSSSSSMKHLQSSFLEWLTLNDVMLIFSKKKPTNLFAHGLLFINNQKIIKQNRKINNYYSSVNQEHSCKTLTLHFKSF